MGLHHLLKLPPGFRERHVNHTLPVPNTFQQKLQRQRRLARSRIAFDEVQVPLRKASPQDVIEANDSRPDPLRSRRSERVR